MSHKTLLLIYHSHIHTVVSYRIILWGNSCHSIHIFWIKKRAIRFINPLNAELNPICHLLALLGAQHILHVSKIRVKICGTRDSCRILLNKLIILPLTSQYILSLPIFGVNNREQFFKNSEIHNINTRHSSNLHLHSANLDIYQNGVYYSGI